MKTFFAKMIALALFLTIITPDASAYVSKYKKYRTVPSSTQRYDPYREATSVTCNFSNASVGIGTLPDGVMVTIDSPDYALERCIKNTSWVSYFTRFGNTVSVDVSNTTRGVQIVATSTDIDTLTNIQNAQWSDIITGNDGSYNQYSYNNTPQPYYYTPPPTYPYSNPSPTYYYPPVQPYTYYTTTPSRTYVAGSSLFNTYGMYRSLGYLTNGVKLTFSSPEYNTMRYLQGYYFSGLFSDFSGISTSTSNIAGGVEITVTSGNTSTVEQIQKIGYALVYQ